MGTLAERLACTGGNLTLERPGAPPLRVGTHPDAAHIVVRTARTARALEAGRQLALAEAFLDGEIDVVGDGMEAARLLDALPATTSAFRQLVGFWLTLHLPGRRRRNRRSIAAHYDHPPEFFLRWFERWRSYSHGFYATPADDPAAAQERKLQYVVDVLGLRPGTRVLDVGAGWGPFVEFAGQRGVQVHGLTLSAEQLRFVQRLIAEQRLPCSIELCDIRDYAPARPFDAVVMLGLLEHAPDYEQVARFLTRVLAPQGRMYADFCAQPGDAPFGPFLRKYVWQGPVAAVCVPRLVRALTRQGFVVHELQDDTPSYAYTVRDWARALDAASADLAREHGERTVRIFRLYLWASQRFLATRRTLAYHLVAGRGPKLSAA